MSTRLVAVLSGVLIMAGCGAAGQGGSLHGTSLAAVFASPPQWPGHAWTRNGHTVPAPEIVAAAGPQHCGWESATFLTVGWPLGTQAQTAEHARQYIRDPNGVVGHGFRTLLNFHATLPGDAQPTGYWYSTVQLFVSPSNVDHAIYLAAGHDVERWPRSDPMTTCS